MLRTIQQAASRRFVLSKAGVMICSKVDIDGYVHQDELTGRITTSRGSHLSTLAKEMATLGQEKVKARHGNDLTYQARNFVLDEFSNILKSS